jgi:pseudaminic acid cytidylyltransferase
MKKNKKQNCIAIIPARGGSKRIPRKNIKKFLGKPLISYSIKTAIKSNLFKKIIVSTDDKQIAKIAKKYGAIVPFVRPKTLSDDFSNIDDVVSHAIKWLKNNNEDFDFVCTIYATAPLLKTKYLKQGLKKLKNSDAKYSFGVSAFSFPIQRAFKIDKNQRCKMFYPKYYKTRSQDLQEAYGDAGQFFWDKVSKKSKEIVFGKDSIPIVIPQYLVQDIDTMQDWKKAEVLYEIENR